jgi:hypothetical protein
VRLAPPGPLSRHKWGRLVAVHRPHRKVWSDGGSGARLCESAGIHPGRGGHPIECAPASRHACGGLSDRGRRWRARLVARVLAGGWLWGIIGAALGAGVFARWWLGSSCGPAPIRKLGSRSWCASLAAGLGSPWRDPSRGSKRRRSREEDLRLRRHPCRVRPCSVIHLRLRPLGSSA